MSSDNTNVEITKILFKLLKNHEWDKFKDYIDKNSEIDLNIRDNSNNYLIHYIILYNKPDLLNLLLSRNAKLDINDSDGRNILYISIKYNYLDIIEIIFKYENKNLGITISDMNDSNGIYPIHYCIEFKNYDALILFKKYKKSFNELDFLDNLPLHYAIKTNDMNIFKIILQETNDINFQTKQGETALHLACNFQQVEMIKELLNRKADVNIQDFSNELSPIMYSVLMNNNEMFYLLFKDSDISLQDLSGNNILHYLIYEKNYSLIDKILERKIDLDISNIQGIIPLHLLLLNYDETKNNIDKFNFDYILENTNLNIQDNEGNSSFLLLCMKNLWKKLKNLKSKKFYNHLLKNKEGIDALDYIKEEDKDEFYEMISKSYLDYVRSRKYKNYNNEIYNICKKELKYKNYNLLKKYLDIDFESKLKKSDNDICIDSIKILLKNKKLNYPEGIKNYCIDLSIFNKNVNFITYTGTTLDVLFGLIYLSITFENVTTSLSTDFIENSDLNNYYLNEKNKKIRREDFNNFEIIWDSNKIFYPTSLDFIINKFKNDRNKKFLIIPIGIELENGSHSNILIYDKNSNSIERFESNGSSFPYKFNYNPLELDKILESKFLSIFSDCKYYYPKDFLPKIGFQLLESYDHFKTKKIGDPGGFCAVWCIWYSYMRIKYDMLDNKKLVLKLIQKIKETNISYKNIVRNFAKLIIDIRDKYLSESKVDINIWLNSSYDINYYNDLILKLKQLISSL